MKQVKAAPAAAARCTFTGVLHFSLLFLYVGATTRAPITRHSTHLLPPSLVQLSDMELTKQQANVMSALKQGNEALKKAQQEVRGWLGLHGS